MPSAKKPAQRSSTWTPHPDARLLPQRERERRRARARARRRRARTPARASSSASAEARAVLRLVASTCPGTLAELDAPARERVLVDLDSEAGGIGEVQIAGRPRRTPLGRSCRRRAARWRGRERARRRESPAPRALRRRSRPARRARSTGTPGAPARSPRRYRRPPTFASFTVAASAHSSQAGVRRRV